MAHESNEGKVFKNLFNYAYFIQSRIKAVPEVLYEEAAARGTKVRRKGKDQTW